MSDRRSGAALVELLAVIAIIPVQIGLLVPVVQKVVVAKVRETAMSKKTEQIAVLEKMAEEFEKVKDLETFKQARLACRDLESKFQKLNEEFNARPEQEREAARIKLEFTEQAAMSRLREAKNNAQKKAAPIRAPE